MAIVSGTDGNDVLEGTLGRDTIDAKAGDDSILLSSGVDTVFGGEGFDELVGSVDSPSINPAAVNPATNRLSYAIGPNYVLEDLGTLQTSFSGIERVSLLDLFGGYTLPTLKSMIVDASQFRGSGGVHLSMTGGNQTMIGSPQDDVFTAIGTPGPVSIAPGFSFGGSYSVGGDGYDLLRIGLAGFDPETVTGSTNLGPEYNPGGARFTSSTGFVYSSDRVEAFEIFNQSHTQKTVDLSLTDRPLSLNPGDVGVPASDDVYIAGSNDDTLYFGEGADRLGGGAGNDLFSVYAIGQAATAGTIIAGDTIADLESGDRISFAGARGAGGVATSFIGETAFSGAAGQLRFERGTTTTSLLFDANGDAVADATLTIVNGTFRLEEVDAGSAVLRIASDLPLPSVGTSGNDRLGGTAGDDDVSGFAGDDAIVASGGQDRLFGGAGFDTVSFDVPAALAALSLDNGHLVVTTQNGASMLDSIEEIRFSDRAIRLADDNPLVDDAYYLATYRDVFLSGLDPEVHYAAAGRFEDRDPNALFDTSGYLGANPDVARANIDPLNHFATFGWREGRDPSASFDDEQYLARNPDVAAAGVNPLLHYLESGRAEGRAIYAAVGSSLVDGFDAEYYLLTNPDVAASGTDPYAHYLQYGWHEGRDPNAYFDVSFYLSANSDVAAAGVDPLTHYLAFGWREGRDSSTAFDSSAYLDAYADVAAAGGDPLQHYLLYGRLEGRATFAVTDPASGESLI